MPFGPIVPQRGLWTPSMDVGGSGTVPGVVSTLSSAFGEWYMVGSLLMADFSIVATNLNGGVGAVFIGGLPFTGDTTSDSGMTAARFSGVNAAIIYINGSLASASSRITIRKSTAGATVGLADTDLVLPFTLFGQLTVILP